MNTKNMQVGVAALAVAMLAGSACANLLVYEGFNYASGNIDGVAANSTGLSGNWTVGGSGAFTVTNGMSFAGHFAATGGSLQSTGDTGGGDSMAGATVSANLTGVTSLYASSIMRIDYTSGSHEIIEQRFNTALGGNYSSSLARNLISTYGASGNTRQVGVSVDSGETGGPVAATQGVPYLLVTAYTVTGSDITGATMYGFDEASYGSYLNNTSAGAAEADLATYANFSVSDTGTTALSNFSYLQFVKFGSTGSVGGYDELRLGTSVTDVVNVVPEPATLGLIGVFGVGALFVRRRLMM